MKLIVGLGNPGEKYEHTRHNIGVMVVEQFLKNFEPVKKTTWQDEKKFRSDVAYLDWQRRSSHSSSGQAQNLMEKVIMCKPKTFMNNSGLAVQLFVTYYKIQSTDIWVVHDEIDLETGMLRIRMGGSSAGHRGIESIIAALGTEKFWRFRLGIGHPKRGGDEAHHKLNQKNVDDFVLGKFDHGEAGKARELIKHGAKAIAGALEDSLEAAINKFNTR